MSYKSRRTIAGGRIVQTNIYEVNDGESIRYMNEPSLYRMLTLKAGLAM